jgi:4-alpha-glucanotransferase
VHSTDASHEADLVNLPATSGEHPNWHRRLSMTLKKLGARPRFDDIAEIFCAEHGAILPKEHLHNV